MALSGVKPQTKTIAGPDGQPITVAKNAKLVKSKGAKKARKAGKIKARTVRVQKKRETQLVEDTKNAIIMRGNKTTEAINQILKDLKSLKAPNAKILNKKNDIHPFDDENSVDFLCNKNDCPLFLVGSHSKKRPNNLIMGRTFDGHVLDMVEFAVEQSKSVLDHKEGSKQIGSKPCFIFQGDEWDRDESLKTVKSLFLDFFRGAVITSVNLAGLDHVIVCTHVNKTVLFRCYHVEFKKSGSKIPRVELVPMGPSLDLSIRRTRPAVTDVMKEALRKPKGLAPKKVKNITRDELSGDKLARIHIGKQEIDKMQTKRMKALRTRKSKDEEGAEGAAESAQ